MNKSLTEQIAMHILNGLGLSTQLNQEKFNSLNSKEYLLSEKLTFLNEDSEDKKNIWGIQSFIENENIKILAADCTGDDESLDYAVVVHLKNNPTYGIYLNINKDKSIESNSLISVSLDGKNWAFCNPYLQGTFLAAMENVKDIRLNWKRAQDYKDEYDSLVTFIKHYDNLFQEDDVNEG